jgi:hypothetical protein
MKNRDTGYWAIAYWGLLICWVMAGALNMAHVRAGFLTSYLADLTIPAWLYIVTRRLWTDKARTSRLMIWLAHSPERTLLSLFAASTATELSTLYWPRGLFAGTFDLMDIFAYASGLLICYYFDKTKTTRRHEE